MKLAVIGLGLIGGSAALVLKHRKQVAEVLGVDNNESHAQTALQTGIADRIVCLEEAVRESDMVLMAVPVDQAVKLIHPVLDLVSQQVVMDMGSTKMPIIRAIRQHPARRRFVAAHPMWGTEFSGPAAATLQAFTGKAAVICDADDSDTDALEKAKSMLTAMGMHLVFMEAEAHDIHTAYISHISHITSFALANTVLEKEKEESAIFELASAGFESTVRLAKSNPQMWVPIFRQNRENVLDVLNEHITQLRKFKACLEKENWDYLHELIGQANQINKILK